MAAEKSCALIGIKLVAIDCFPFRQIEEVEGK
jgi:hypothetical protein